MSAVVSAFRDAALRTPDSDVLDLLDEVKAALEGDSNDAEHDALASVACFFGLGYTNYDDVLED